MSYDRTERIRRAAILVASLEETLAEQMLQSLPAAEATKILAEVERLEELDPAEVQDVLDEFRAAGRRGRAGDDGVEFTYSAPQPVVRQTAASAAPVTNPADDAAGAAASAQEEADAAMMAELLTHEHPQTIAAALSRLGHDQGAAVFAKLPAGMQAEVLDRLANLEPADEDAVQELESQLQTRIEQQRQRRKRAVAAAEMARRMIEKTPPAQRESLLARLSPQEMDEPARAAPANQDRLRVEQRARNLAAAMQQAPPSGEPEFHESPQRFEAWSDGPTTQVATAPASMRVLLDDRSQELESLNDRALLHALRVADERTVQCALAASSEKFLSRVAGKLPRRQAARLREMVRSIGPTRLTELRGAQHELLRLAHGGATTELAGR